jgi:mannose-1-phosphate guanylyltransferase
MASLQVPVRGKSGKQPSTKAVILVGGPSRGTRFRPLSLDLPKVSLVDISHAL